MAAKVSFKSMDYFKYRKYIIDKDDSSTCSKEVTSLCTCVQTLNMRDDKFDDGDEEWNRLETIFTSYKQILSFKKVETVDVKLKSGWWGDQKSGLSVGKIKPNMLKETLVFKCKDWCERHNEEHKNLDKSIEGPGVYVFKHKEKSCFQIVLSCLDNIFSRCAEIFKASFDGITYTPLGSLLVISLANDWDFYFIPAEGNSEILKVLENDTLLKHDTLWPHGLNMTLSIETPFDIKQFRESCVRHNWPPERVIRPSKLQSLDCSKLKEHSKSRNIPATVSNQIRNNGPSSRPNSARPVSLQEQKNLASPSSQVSPLNRPSTAYTKRQKNDETVLNKKGFQNKTDISLRESNRSKSTQNIKKETSRESVDKKSRPIESKNSEIGKLPLNNANKKEKIDSISNLSNLNGNQKDVSQCEKDSDENNEDEFFELKPMKRSGTFTLSDTEEEKQQSTVKNSTLSSRALMAAEQLNAKRKL